MSQSTRLLRRLTLLLGVIVVAAGVAASAAAAAERQEVTFSVSLFFPGPSAVEPTVTELNAQVVRVEDVRYFGVGSPDALGDEAGAQLSWIVNREQMRGAVSGSVTMHDAVLELQWEGALRGRVTPGGAEGVLHLTEVSTGQRFSGSWSAQGFVDPASNPHAFTMVVTGTLTGG